MSTLKFVLGAFAAFGIGYVAAAIMLVCFTKHKLSDKMCDRVLGVGMVASVAYIVANLLK